MKRTFATTTFAIALLGIGACKGGGGDAVKLVPDAATVIGGVDIAGLQKSPIWEDNKKFLEEGEAKEGLDAAKECNIGLDKWKTVTFGMDPMKGDSAMVLVFNADGIGKKENLECIHGKIKEKDGNEPWTMEEKDGKLVLTIDEGKATGYVINDNTLAVAGKDWAGSVKELIDGKGKAAVDGSLKDVVGRADKGKTIWAAGNLPADLLKGSPAEGATDAAASVDLSAGFGLAASVAFGSAEDAKAKADELQKQFDQMKGMATTMGAPQAAVDSVKIEAKDAAVQLSASITAEDLKKVQEAAMKNM